MAEQLTRRHIVTDPGRWQAWVLSAATALFLGAVPVKAAEPFYLGAWNIVRAEVAPWAKSGPVPDASESRRLLGKTITLDSKAIRGPGSFPCQGPRYEVIEGSAEMLFQGMLGAMHEKDPGVDPQKVAEAGGLSGKVYRTVITGCEFAVDFSFGSDPKVAQFALDNYVYTLQRQ
jgi:hypothetical protein